MSRSRPFNNGAFRFALLIGTVFAIGFVLLLVVVERSLHNYANEATSVGLRAETVTLMSEFAYGGRPALVRTIARRHQPGYEQPFRYALIDRDGRRLLGDLSVLERAPGWGIARGPSDDAGAVGAKSDAELLRSLVTRMPDGTLLVVATDTFDVQALRRRVDIFTIVLGSVLTLLVLVGGYVVGAILLRRLARVNRGLSGIMAGDLAQRLPPIGMSPEFDELTGNLNRMLDRIGQLVESLRQVSTDIAHDLRTPLTRLRQQLEVAREGPTPEAYEQGIDAALMQTDEILAIFRALLRISTLEAGEGRLRLVEIDLSEVMNRVGLAYLPVAEDAGWRLDLRIEPGVTVLGDATLLAQLFTNLVENALAHTPTGTAIALSLITVSGAAVASVADNGPGIPVAARDKVLRRFVRLDPSRHTAGAGLGLSLVAAIAHLHGADLTLTGNHPGLRVSLRFGVS